MNNPAGIHLRIAKECPNYGVHFKTMAAVRSTANKSTEQKLRFSLVSRGLKGWNLHEKNIVGTPDFVFSQHRLAVFVDGCFWHGCPDCYRRPKRSRKYWDQKVDKNRKRDALVNDQLQTEGWRVLRLWEHDLRLRLDYCVNQINEIIG